VPVVYADAVPHKLLLFLNTRGHGRGSMEMPNTSPADATSCVKPGVDCSGPSNQREEGGMYFQSRAGCSSPHIKCNGEDHSSSLSSRDISWPLTSTARKVFRSCARSFTNPFSSGFQLDPTSLNSPSPFFSLDTFLLENMRRGQRNGTARGQERRKLSVLDFGGTVGGKWIVLHFSIISN
jgi:hypothetical protein